MLISDSIKSEYLDNAHYDIGCAFLSEGFSKLDSIIVSRGSGLMPFVYTGSALKTQEFGLSCIVTPEQDQLLSSLYSLTMHPGYVDERYPIKLSWGHASQRHEVECYLADYAPPGDISYEGAKILEVTLTLRPI